MKSKKKSSSKKSENLKPRIIKLFESNQFSNEEYAGAFDFQTKIVKENVGVLSDELAVSSLSVFHGVFVNRHSENKMVLEEKYSIKRDCYSFEWRVQVSWDSDTDIKIMVLPILVSKSHSDFLYDCRITKVSSVFSSGSNYKLTPVKDFSGSFRQVHCEESTRTEFKDSFKLGICVDLIAIVDPLLKNTFSQSFKFLSNSGEFKKALSQHQKSKYSLMELDVHKIEPLPNDCENQILFNGESDQLEKMSKEQLYCDAVIIVQNQKLYAHKWMLSAYIPVFEQQFSMDNQELPYTVIEIDEFHYETVERMLTFIYTNEIFTSDRDSVIDLLKIASKYAIKLLTIKCEQILLQYLNIDTSTYFMALGDDYNASELKKKATKIFMTNHKHYDDSIIPSPSESLSNNIQMIPNNNMEGL